MSSDIKSYRKKQGRDRADYEKGRTAILNKRIKQDLTEKITFEHLSKEPNKEQQILWVLEGRAYTSPQKESNCRVAAVWEHA